MSGQATGDGETGVDHRAQLTRQFHAAREPVELEAQRVLHFGNARTGKTRLTAHGAGIGRDSVDVVPAEARVVDGRDAGIEGQPQRVLAEATSHVGLPHPGETRAAFEDLRHDAPPVGSNTGMKTSSYSSNSTFTAIPILTSSAGQFTMFVIRRKPDCSSSSTIAMQ